MGEWGATLMALPTRPAFIPLPDASAFPPELLPLRHWVAYDLVERDGKWTKIPINPRTGAYATTTNASTWGTFEEARVRAARDAIGVGFILAPPFFGFDLDGCLRDGVPSPMAMSVLGELSTYAETSISGTGVKGIGIGIKPGTRCRRAGLLLEIYDHARLFALTGDRLSDAPLAINDCQEGLDHIYNVAFGQEPASSAAAWNPAAVTDDDQAVIDWLRNCKSGARFDRYWNGQDDGDPSGGDLGLMNMIAWRVGPATARIEAIFNASARADRDKWQGRPDYRARTIRAAIDGCKGKFYEEGPSARRASASPLAPPADEKRHASEASASDLAPFLAMSHEALARRAHRAERFNQASMLFERNRGVRTQKPTVRAVLFEYNSMAQRGKLDADGWARTSLAALGATGGVSKDAAGDHLRDIAAWDIGIKKEVRDEEYRVPAPHGGEIIHMRPRLYIKVVGDVVDMLEQFAKFTPPKRAGEGSWGGKRPCSACGSTNTRHVVHVQCYDCGHVSKPIAPTPVIVPALDEIPLAPESSPHGQPSYKREYPPAEEEEAHDLPTCAMPGCGAWPKPDRRYCDRHRGEDGLASRLALPHAPSSAPYPAADEPFVWPDDDTPPLEIMIIDSSYGPREWMLS